MENRLGAVLVDFQPRSPGSSHWMLEVVTGLPEHDAWERKSTRFDLRPETVLQDRDGRQPDQVPTAELLEKRNPLLSRNLTSLHHDALRFGC